jgi:nucleotide-binding universal stress UspA family protein
MDRPSGADTVQSVEERLGERLAYLRALAAGLPPDLDCQCEVIAHEDAAGCIVEWSLQHRPDIIVMSTHGRTGRVHVLFGDVAEEVVRSGVRPVLLVPPAKPARARQQTTVRPRVAR